MSEPRGSLSVYATVAGLCSALPVPVLDNYLGRLARGAGVRRAAKQHGVVLEAKAREILSEPGVGSDAIATPAFRTVRSILTRWNVPGSVVGSVEDGLAAFLATTLVAHYIERHRPVEHADKPLGEAEARQLRRQVTAAAAEGLLRIGKATPRNIGQSLKRLGQAIEESSEDRKATQRIMDSLLDSLADAPEQTMQAFREAFDRRMQKERMRNLPGNAAA